MTFPRVFGWSKSHTQEAKLIDAVSQMDSEFGADQNNIQPFNTQQYIRKL